MLVFDDAFGRTRPNQPTTFKERRSKLDLQKELRDQPLRVGISTRALFDLEKEHEVFKTEGVKAYVKLQRDREDQLPGRGSGFQVVERLLNLNEEKSQPFVEVILMS